MEINTQHTSMDTRMEADINQLGLNAPLVLK